jgi:hypothetical protein
MDFILIGGWAVYLWAHTQKSKDVDIVVQLEKLHQLKTIYDLRKNGRLKKYEIKMDEIDVDIYVPHYSQLAVPLEKIETAKIEGFLVARIEEILILKQGAENQRGSSDKGEKDRIDIMSLVLLCDIDWDRYANLLEKFDNKQLLQRLIILVKNFKEYKYFNLTPRELKLKKEKLLEILKRL